MLDVRAFVRVFKKPQQPDFNDFVVILDNNYA